MKVGDYVRTKSYGINKINGFSSTLEEDFIDCAYDKYQRVLISKKEIIKSSPNIIDLIELGDLVRLFMEDDVDKEDTNIFEVVAIDNDKKEIGVFTGDFETEFFPMENLRGIVTKEQFENMEYKINKE